MCRTKWHLKYKLKKNRKLNEWRKNCVCSIEIDK